MKNFLKPILNAKIFLHIDLFIFGSALSFQNKNVTLYKKSFNINLFSQKEKKKGEFIKT